MAVLCMAEIDGKCVRKHAEQLRALRVQPLIGDQGDTAIRKQAADAGIWWPL